MGQYYRPVFLNEEEKPKTFFYAHKYGNGLKLMEHSYLGNDFVSAVEHHLFNNAERVVWAGDYADEENGTGVNLYALCDDANDVAPNKDQINNGKFVVNLSKHQFIDKTKIEDGNDSWGIHPLPLMTCEGNGRGGGDYHGENEFIGTWSRDLIMVSDDVPEGYVEIKPNFIDG